MSAGAGLPPRFCFDDTCLPLRAVADAAHSMFSRPFQRLCLVVVQRPAAGRRLLFLVSERRSCLGLGDLVRKRSICDADLALGSADQAATVRRRMNGLALTPHMADLGHACWLRASTCAGRCAEQVLNLSGRT